MTFAPSIPVGGIAGLRFLDRTQASQQAVFERSPLIDREVIYFKENIASITSAEELVTDRTLFKVALGAFGLDEEIDKKFFMRKILEEGVLQPDTLANRFVDPRYRTFSEAFGFGSLSGPKVARSDFAETITSAYKDRQFEIAVGDSNTDLRLVMNFRREISSLVETQSDLGAWFTIMGSLPARAVLEQGLGMPSSIASFDLDQQRELFQSKAKEVLGIDTAAELATPEVMEQLLNRFMALSTQSASTSASTPGFAALSLLQSGGATSAASSIMNLLLSNT